MNWKRTLREIYAISQGLHIHDYDICEKLEEISGLKWKPRFMEEGYADWPTARYIVKSDGSVSSDEVQKRANKILYGNESHQQPGNGFAYIMRDDAIAALRHLKMLPAPALLQ